MEEKTIKVRLGTVICICIIILLLIVIGIIYYLGFIKNNNDVEPISNTAAEKNAIQNIDKQQIIVEEYANIGQSLFEKYLETQEELVEYKINSCKLICYYSDEFICGVNYDVKVEGSLKDSVWMAGNGEIDGSWMRGKSVFLSFKKINGEYIYNEEVGQMTGWDINYFISEENNDSIVSDLNKGYSDLAKNLFGNYLEKQKEIVSYNINSCNMLYYYDDEFICGVNYDVKVEGSLEDSIWMAGNGEIDGSWMRGKSVFLGFKKINGEYIYNEEVGQMTAWNPTI